MGISHQLYPAKMKLSLRLGFQGKLTLCISVPVCEWISAWCIYTYRDDGGCRPSIHV